jgi:hypothetical protein
MQTGRAFRFFTSTIESILGYLPYQIMRDHLEQSFACNQDESATVFPLALPH